MTRKQIIAIVLFILTLAGKLLFDLHLYYSGGVNNHMIGPAIVLVSLTICSWLAGWISIPMWLFGWWSIFDPLYAVFIHQVLFYVGDTATLDKIQRHYPVVIVLKYLLATTSTIFYVVYSKHQKKVLN